MHENETYILTGPIHSGKTSYLEKFIQQRSNAFGVLSPEINGKRVFVDISTKETFAMEAEDERSEVLEIGKFRFSKKAFEKAAAIIDQASLQPAGWLIIDEIGPLELKGEGFFQTLNNVLRTTTRLKIIIVVREQLVENVVQKFAMSNYRVITTDTLI